MSLVSELDLPVLDYTDPELRGERFHDAMLALRDAGWLATCPLGAIVLDREAAAFFLRSRSAIFPGLRLAELFDVPDGPLREQIERNVLNVNGDDHRRLRNLVNPAFTPRAADRWRPAMRGFLAELWEPLAGRGGCEVVHDLSGAYPAKMIATVMGAPVSDAGRLYEWSNQIQRQFDGPSLLEDRPAIERAVEQFYAWAGELLARRREEPSDDLISTLIAVEEQGDRLSDVELVNLVLNVLVGGVDTTQSQLAHALRLLAGHPEQWELLAERPELVPAAVEEILRFEPITPFTARILVEDVEYRGVTFPRDTVVLVCAFTANRDREHVRDPDRFDVTAQREGAKPLTFGAGPHHCLGANLARAELEEALAFLAPRMRDLALDGEPAYGSIHGIYGLEELRVRFRPDGAADSAAPIRD